MARKKKRQVRVECVLIWEAPQTLIVEGDSKADAIRRLKNSMMAPSNNGKTPPNRIKLKNAEFV